MSQPDENRQAAQPEAAENAKTDGKRPARRVTRRRKTRIASSGVRKRRRKNKQTGDSAELIAKLEAERDEWIDRAQRIQAEFINTRNRMLKEQKEKLDHAGLFVIRDMIPILENVTRGLDVGEEATVDSMKGGLQLIQREIDKFFRKYQVMEIPAKGEKFDPEVHNAISVVTIAGADDNTVIEVLKKGYTYKGMVVEPATVVVARAPEEEREKEREPEEE
jgi:molecular chaperone GrpE